MSKNETKPYIDLSKQIESLAQKAVDAFDSGDAMRYAQAACNAANAQACVNNDLYTQQRSEREMRDAEGTNAT